MTKTGQTITLRQGDCRDLTFEVVDEDDTAVPASDVSSATWRVATSLSGTADLEKTADSITDGSSALEVEVDIDTDDTANLDPKKTYQHQLVLTMDDGCDYTATEGDFDLKPRIGS